MREWEGDGGGGETKCHKFKIFGLMGKYTSVEWGGILT